jgi:transposase
VSQGITTKVRSDFCDHGQRKEAILELSDLEREEAEYLVESLVHIELRLSALEKRILEESVGEEVIERLQTVPGVGPKTSFAFVAHVGAERFDNAQQVSNYLGLVPRVYISGESVRYGRITKRGNGYLRALLVQSAWALTNTKKGGKLKDRFEYMTKEKSISKKKAIVAIARRLAELLYVLMRDGAAYAYLIFLVINGQIGLGEFVFIFAAVGTISEWVFGILTGSSALM